MHKTDKVLSVCSATQTCKKQSWNNFSLYLHVYLFVCMSMCFTAYDTYKHDNINVAETLTLYTGMMWKLEALKFHEPSLLCIMILLSYTFNIGTIRTDCNHFHSQYFSLQIRFIHICNNKDRISEFHCQCLLLCNCCVHDSKTRDKRSEIIMLEE